MNILAPYSWIKEHLQTEFVPEDYAAHVALVGNEVERQYRADAYMGPQVVVGKILAVHPHPNADKLRLVTTEIAPGQQKQIVCGGSNLEVGMTVAVAVPGATVSWHGEDEVELKETKIRGEESFGMICAAEEIGFPKLADGQKIWDLSAMLADTPAGTPLAEALELKGEVIFDIEQTTNRPDGMSIVGQAREGYAAMLGTFSDPLAQPAELPALDDATTDALTVTVEDTDLCPRYMGLLLDVEVGPSPWWMQKRLLLAGAKPINNVVDVTNYVRLELGQPLHAFDYNKIDEGAIVVRTANDGEKIVALDEEEYELASDMLVIADANKPVAVAGIMGGLHSGVNAQTTRIVLEAATFNSLSIRKTWRALNLQSDSQTLYEKGVSAQLAAYGMARAVELLKDIANAKVVSEVKDSRTQDYTPKTFTLTPSKTNALIGVEIDTPTQVGMLERLGFGVEPAGDDAFTVTVPFWRDMDIEADVDLIEEIARLYGYANLPSTLPGGVIPARERDTLLDREEEIKDVLAGAGWTEIYGNSFINKDDLVRAGFDASQALALQNPLTDENVMRPSLVPTVLCVSQENELHPTAEQLFELQRVYLPREGELPEERSMLVASVMADKAGEDLFRRIKGALQVISDRYHVDYRLERDGVPEQFHPGRAASVWIGDVRVGVIGEVHPLVHQAFGIDRHVALLELDLPVLEPLLRLTPSYQESSEFPSVYRDIAMLVDEGVEYAELEASMQAASELLQHIELFDLYRGKQVPEGKKSLAVHLQFQVDRTLTSEEVDAEMKRIIGSLTNKHQAEIRE